MLLLTRGLCGPADCVHSVAGNRPIILSSFDPSICLLARHKQLRYPVFFLTAAGTHLVHNTWRARSQMSTSLLETLAVLWLTRAP